MFLVQLTGKCHLENNAFIKKSIDYVISVMTFTGTLLQVWPVVALLRILTML